MNTIGSDCLNIINDYKYQLEHKDKFSSSLKEIKQCQNCNRRIITK